ncbi:MAG TPA: hypothetical protein ENK46_07340 [Flavobacteriia bacterium]|nr:hypothetical protein [Flavobacteriia bacterium]
MTKKIDVVLLTDARYVRPKETTPYITNVLLEDRLVQQALYEEGLTTLRLAWDDPVFDWSTTHYALFRSTWDYFDRFGEFSNWLAKTGRKTCFINAENLIKWNIDKQYLQDLEQHGVHCAPTLFIEAGTAKTLAQLHKETQWETTILKPVVSGAARHTYKLTPKNLQSHEALFKKLIANESFMLQPFQHSIIEKGELSLIIIDGAYSHAVLKKAKKGDFRVQDDYGGSVHQYHPTSSEIAFAIKAVNACRPKPLYARVDMFTDNHGQLAIAELELIEPELWFRMQPNAARKLAIAIKKLYR